jgi:hypothetical protein
MPFFDKINNFNLLKNKKELSLLLIIVLLSSLAGLGLAYALERFVFNQKPLQSSTTLAQTDGQGFSSKTAITKSSISSTKTSTSSEAPKINDKYGRKNTYNLKKSGINAGFVWATDIRDLFQTQPFDNSWSDDLEKNAPQQPKPLDEVVAAPKDCPAFVPGDPTSINNIKSKKNWLSYPKYNIEAPLQNGSFQDFYISDSKTGNIKIDSPIQEDQRDIDRGNYESVPVQKLLKSGIVHLPITPQPGQVGNSYIIGHTSNFPQVVSNYNTIFKPLERASQIGEEFFVWDHQCRKLKFVVFESLAIREEDVDTAYKNFGDRRVVTLQGSILELVKGYLQPTKRWLTRGELVVEK